MNKICTIIGQNYLAQAMTLLESVKEIYPDIDFTVLITDSETEFKDLLPGARVISPRELPMEPGSFQVMKQCYDQVELATSLKPYLLRYLLTDKTRSVTYLDPDIQLFGELEEGMQAAAEVGIALTPHRTSPSTIQDLNSTDFSFLKYGTYNLGYISVGRNALPMLDWWSERLRWFSTRFPDDFIFTDQKWMNLVPSYFETRVIKNRGYNLASWNIDERPLRVKGKSLKVGDSPLVFVHYSQMSGALSKGINPKLWESNNAADDQTLFMINALTDRYMSNLLKASELIKSKGYFPSPGGNEKLADIFYRKRQLDASFESYLLGQDFVIKSQTKTNLFILSKIQRSASVRGFSLGLSSDFKKLKRRLGKFS
jgi:hypothetical protein